MKATIVICFCFLLAACSRSALPVNEYLQWVESGNGIETKKNVDDYEFTVKYLPRDFLAYRDLRNETISSDKLNQAKGGYNASYCLIFKVAAKDHDKDILKGSTGTKEEYYGRMQYFLSGIQHDLTLNDGTEDLHCTICNFERVYNLNPYLTFYLVFDRKKPEREEHFNHNLVLTYNDNALGSGKINLSLEASDLNDIPKLQIP